ncbi:MAG: zf-TFIIB domain-containing protein [Polyangiales bacterium]
MNCPRCDKSLHASTALRAHSCRECGGRWVPSASVEEWRELRESVPPAAPKPGHDKLAAVCPEGHGFLRRVRMEELGFSLDRCPRCGGVWFDHGEWDRLAEANVVENLSVLWDPAFRAAKRQEKEQARIDDELRAQIGEESFARLREFTDWLTDEPAKSRVLAWIEHELREET